MNIKIHNFKESEFREWAALMNPGLQVRLDILRHRIGKAVIVSGNPYALGRYAADSASEHNVDYWGSVLAADCFVNGVYTREESEGVVHEAVNLGFTGIGVYADTRNNKGEWQVMFHLGVRPTRNMGDPATWGRVNGTYVSLDEALNNLPTE